MNVLTLNFTLTTGFRVRLLNATVQRKRAQYSKQKKIRENRLQQVLHTNTKNPSLTRTLGWWTTKRRQLSEKYSKCALKAPDCRILHVSLVSKCSAYAKDKDECSALFIRTEVLRTIVIVELNAPDKSSGHKVQQIHIYYRFNIAVSTANADNRKYYKKEKAA